VGTHADLTPAQRRAVTYNAGPLLIIAGAGTGKTTVITQRLAALLQAGYTGDQILAVTFTNKATEEMEQRLDKLMPIGYESPWIFTFHAFGERVLRENALLLGLSPDFEVLTPARQQILLRKHLFDLELKYLRPLGNPTKFIAALVQHFSRAKDEGVTPATYQRWATANLKRVTGATFNDDFAQSAALEEAERYDEIARAFTIYDKVLHESGHVDIADLIALVLELFKTRPSVLARYRAQFKSILVDEFQDTNFAQYQLIRLLTTPSSNVTVVADDDQSIYRWRGASVTNVLLFMKDYPKAEKIALLDNFRSTQGILDTAYRAIQVNNPHRLETKLTINKKLVSVRGAGKEPQHVHCQTREQELRFLVETILAKHDAKRAYSDIAVLVRSNSAADAVANSLSANDIPFQFVAPRGLYARPEILDLMAFVRVIADVRDSVAMFRLLKTQPVAVDALDLVSMLHHAKRWNISLFEVLELCIQKKDDQPIVERDETKPEPHVVTVSPRSFKNIQKLLKLLAHYVELSQRKTIGPVVFEYVEEIGLLESLLKQESADNIERILNINQFFRALLQFEREAEEATARAWVEHVDLLNEAGDNPIPADVEATPDAVRLMTVHAAKGLEFPVVIVFNMTEQHFPAISRRESIELPLELVAGERAMLPDADSRALHLAEERRLFYVACTRARDELILTSCNDDGGSRKRKISRFIKEAGIVTEILEAKPELSQTPTTGTTAKKSSRIVSLPLPGRFSYTQLTVFDSCPLQYKFAHLYKIPSLGSPTFSYGKSIHETLAAFYRLIDADTPPPTKETLLTLLNEYWLSEWYHSKTHEQQRKEAAKIALSNYYDQNKTSLNRPFWIEQDFTLRVGDYRLNGRVDRADELPDGTLEIIDYKTGSLKKESELKKNNQLALYALAAQQVFKKTASKLTWYFIDEGKKVTTTRTPVQLQELEREIKEKIGEIVASDFIPTPGFHCKFCDFKKICEAGQASGFA
jgi:DNA helicase-2/ATP-dependent DNA helicase PcrA